MRRFLTIGLMVIGAACSSNEVGTKDTSAGFGGSTGVSGGTTSATNAGPSTSGGTNTINTTGSSTTTGTPGTTSGTGTVGSGGTTTTDTTGGTPTTNGSNTTGSLGGSSANTTGATTAAMGGSGGATSTDGMASTDGVAMGGCDGGPLDAPIPNCAPTPAPDTGDYYADCVARINQLRWECQCLPPLERWTEGEDCANQHAQYDSETGEFHSGFTNRICDNGGSAQNECPGWRSTGQVVEGCLQDMWDEGPGEPYSAHGHYINMTNPDYGRVACGMYETPEGEIWAVQNFSR